jgi:hypothetical protein
LAASTFSSVSCALSHFAKLFTAASRVSLSAVVDEHDKPIAGFKNTYQQQPIVEQTFRLFAPALRQQDACPCTTGTQALASQLILSDVPYLVVEVSRGKLARNPRFEIACRKSASFQFFWQSESVTDKTTS